MSTRAITPTWDEVLDALEYDLGQFVARLDNPNWPAPTPTFSAPADIGPIPAEYAVRASSLAAAYDAAVQRAEEQSTQLGAELGRISAVGHIAPRPGRFRVDFQG
jgi:hypothetical protein